LTSSPHRVGETDLAMLEAFERTRKPSSHFQSHRLSGSPLIEHAQQALIREQIVSAIGNGPQCSGRLA